MPGVIDITNQFPPTRQSTVLLELLRIVRNLQNEGIEVVICGGWVPFLKQLARENRTEHLGSLDIDPLFRQAAREPDVIDRIRRLVVDRMKFEQSRTDAFRYEKKVEDNIVQRSRGLPYAQDRSLPLSPEKQGSLRHLLLLSIF